MGHNSPGTLSQYSSVQAMEKGEEEKDEENENSHSYSNNNNDVYGEPTDRLTD